MQWLIVLCAEGRQEEEGILKTHTAEASGMSRTGSIKRTGSTWGFVVDIGRKDGRRQQVRKRGFRTRKDAQTALNEALAALQHGAYARPRRITFGSYLTDWVASLATTGRRPTTIAGYDRLIRIHVAPDLGDIPIQELTAVDLDRLYARLKAVGSPAGWGPLSNRSIRYVHAVIGKALHDAERKGLLSRNVARLASPPSSASARSAEMKVWTPDELRAFLDVTDHGFAPRSDDSTGRDDGPPSGRVVRAAPTGCRARQGAPCSPPVDHDRRSPTRDR